MENKVVLHKQICDSLNELYINKNKDYGDSFAKMRKEYPNAILIRLFDKYSRLKRLMQLEECGREGEQMVKSERIEDTLIDLANYAIMELVERNTDVSSEAVSTETVKALAEFQKANGVILEGEKKCK